jgi:hypothetical protein
MATAQMIRWSEISDQQKAEQFKERGKERTARSALRSSCVICDKPVIELSKYFEINGIRFAHRSCVVDDSGELSKPRQTITHRMVEEAKAKKVVATAPAKRGRKPNTVTKAITSATKSATPATRVSTTKPAKRSTITQAQRSQRSFTWCHCYTNHHRHGRSCSESLG